MTRELLLLRHGKSDWRVDTDDYHRPLKKRGKKGAQQIGNWLIQQQRLPDYILSSPATRAMDTTRRCCRAMQRQPEQIHPAPSIYLADVATLLAVLSEVPVEAQRVLLTGHNPGLEELLLYLAQPPVPIPGDGKLLPTATLARLQMPDDWRHLQPGCARLLQIQRAGELAPDSKGNFTNHSSE